MPLTLAAALAAATITATCEWQAPRGTRPLTEPFDTVIQRFTEIPPEARARLIADVRANRYTDQVTIKRDTIKGDSGAEYADLRMMHFAGGLLCRKVTLRSWSKEESERALIYQTTDAAGTVYTLARPEVCKNWSIVTMTRPRPPQNGSPPATVLIPPIEAPGGFEAPIQSPRMSLAFIDPPPVTFQPLNLDAEFAFVEPEPWRITADQPWYDLWQWRPLFGPIPQRTFVPVGDVPIVPVPTFPPVPGVVPPAYPFPDRLPPSVPGLPSGDVPIAPVPELSTWALMLGGLVWVLFAVSRRRQQ